MSLLNDYKNDLIKAENCSGDKIHNKFVNILIKDIIDSRLSELILNEVISSIEPNWIFNIFTKAELQKLNSIMKAKSEQTLLKRKQSFINFLKNGRYGYLYNNYKITAFSRIFEFNYKKL